MIMRNILKYQNGMSFTGALIMLALLGCLFLFGLRAFPIYTEYFAVKSSMQSVANQPYTNRSSLSKIRSSLAKNFNINGVYSYNSNTIKKISKVKKENGKRYLKVKYDIDNRFFKNLYLTIKIDESIELPGEGSK